MAACDLDRSKAGLATLLRRGKLGRASSESRGARSANSWDAPLSASSASVKPLDRSRLAKVLGRSGSSFDGEALEATRLANRMLRDARLTWPEVIAGIEQPTGAASTNPDAPLPMPDGTLLSPPYGRRWLETILWLLQQQRRVDARDSTDGVWLSALPVRLRNRPIRWREAARLLAIYRTYAPATKR
jgi:hypothetical protein